jgi:pimeloyl-ACP methyl ester carboxylesterase
MAGVSALIAASLVSAAVVRAAEGDPLKRRGAFGVVAKPVTETAKSHHGLADEKGVEIAGLIPGGTAADQGIAEGDVIVALDGKSVDDVPQFVHGLAGKKAGARLKVVYYHDGAKVEKDLTLKGAPLESNPDRETIYGSVESQGRRLRTIITKPKGKAAGKRPALFLIQGIGAFTIEASPLSAVGGYRAILDDFSARGYITMRVDKPGCGDSEGGPLQDADFDSQLDGFRQALKSLKADPDVDPDQILIFGHSMGGAWGPLIALDSPVRGIAVYGTLAKTWLEYNLENHRRQLALAGRDPSAIDQTMHQLAAVDHYVNHEGLTPEQVAAKEPALRPMVDEIYQEGKYYAGCHYLFFRQLSSKNLAEAWTKFPGHALAVWGKADFVSSESDHALVAEIVNRAHPGHGKFLALDGSDHGFNQAESQEKSFEVFGKSPAPFNPAIVKALREWSESVITRKP